MPFLADHDHQGAVATEAGLGIPEARREAPALATPPGEEREQVAPLVRDLEPRAVVMVKGAETALEILRLGADLAREKTVLTKQHVVVIVVERHRQTVIVEQQEGQRARLDLDIGNEVPHEGLEKGLVGDPRGAEKPHHVGRWRRKSRIASTLRRRRHHHWLPIWMSMSRARRGSDRGRVAGGTWRRSVSAAFAFVEDVAIDQAFRPSSRSGSSRFRRNRSFRYDRRRAHRAPHACRRSI